MTKRKAKPEPNNVVPLPVPVLTRPVGVASGKGTPKAELRGFEPSLDRIIEIRRDRENLETEEKLLREPLEKAAKLARADLESRTGTTIKSVVVHGTQQPGRFTWRNAYRTADVVHEPALRGCLGPHFDGLFEINYKLKPRATSSAVVSELRAALGPRFESLFEATPEIAPRDELMEKRTVLRSVLTEQQNIALDLILEQIQASPMLSVK